MQFIIGNIVITREYPGEVNRAVRPVVSRITNAVKRDAVRGCPVDQGDLMESIRAEHQGLIGRVWVGTNHWHATEYGSPPHLIQVRNRKALYDAETGTFFGRRVEHPGTPSQPFMRPAIYRRRVL